MPRIAYVETRFSRSSLEIVEKANAIIAEYDAQGFGLTLRQLYYQFVSRGLIANRQSEYKRLGSVINDARLAGLIDWNAIEDRGRNLVSFPSWRSPQEILVDAAKGFRLDPWDSQDTYVEVWVEKEALSGVVGVACEARRVPYFACKGYVSQSEMWGAAVRRLLPNIRRGKAGVVIHLGDHDPSGIDMTRDIEDRLGLFLGRFGVEVRRIALNFDQIEEQQPPPNPAKTTDSRFESYLSRFGSESWELDALEPSYIAEIISAEIEPMIDTDEWDRVVTEEGRHVEAMTRIAENYERVRSVL